MIRVLRALRLTIAGLLIVGCAVAVTARPLPDSYAPGAAGDVELVGGEIPAVIAQNVKAPVVATLPPGHFLVGAARASLAPAPEVFGNWDAGDRWRRKNCTSAGVDGDNSINQDHVLPKPGDDPRGWPAASPNCIYLGGLGLGPVRPAVAVGHGGVWVRTLAISNGKDLFTYSIADSVGWFARYDSRVGCTDCGILDVRESLSASLGIPVGNVVVGSTHTHAGPDTYGGWGGVPTWYRKQLRDATIASVKQAVANAREATLHAGEAALRDRNNQRRDNYWSTADTGATWLQARSVGASPAVIATLGAFAGHPTIVGSPVLHADWPGATARRFESTFGGVGLLFEGGLGNVSISGTGDGTDEQRAESTGIAVADRIAGDIASRAVQLTSSTMKAAVEPFEHPVSTNPGLVTLGSAGLFDREFAPNTPGGGLPTTYTYSKDGDTRPTAQSCQSAGPTIKTVAGAHRIGEFVVAFGPGEMFSNMTEVLKEDIDRTVATMVLGQTNDALGYIIQSFEFDASTNVVTHYGFEAMPIGPGGAEYEEVFALDRCLGDHTLDVLVRSARSANS